GDGGQLLDERPELAAAGAAPEPAGGDGAAFGAGVLDGDLGDTAIVRVRPDADCAEIVPR
ncbi:MAG TPA: hypothetical protein VLN26_05580, partial [Gaiellaceae bacterium]|nr:hypothetical protein [Gaiellaceae bacterium]